MSLDLNSYLRGIYINFNKLKTHLEFQPHGNSLPVIHTVMTGSTAQQYKMENFREVLNG